MFALGHVSAKREEEKPSHAPYRCLQGVLALCSMCQLALPGVATNAKVKLNRILLLSMLGAVVPPWPATLNSRYREGSEDTGPISNTPT